MSPEYEALREKVRAAMWAADNMDAAADAALRVVAEALREPTHTQTNRGGIAILETRLAQERQPIHSGAGDQAEACWRAMLAAHPIAEALRDE